MEADRKELQGQRDSLQEQLQQHRTNLQQHREQAHQLAIRVEGSKTRLCDLHHDIQRKKHEQTVKLDR